ncbi:MAG: phosphatidate cytidylyltransferase [Firmicutes bacterium]|nr:phosphatidate cytidylyltransferase [Bacillota bacterium]
MKKRLITGLIIALIWAGIAVVSIVLEGRLFYVFDVFVLVLAVVSCFEVTRLIKQKFAKPYEILIIATIFLSFSAYFILDQFSHTQDFAILAFIGVIVLAIALSFVLVKFSKIKSTQHAVTTSFVLIYPLSLFLFMLGINTIPLIHIRAASILLLFLIAPLTDTFAFLTGSILKGPKLAPKISPKKTISGAFGGLIGGVLAGILVFGMIVSGLFDFFSLRPISANLDIMHFIFIGLLGSIFTQAGDLIASMVKRKANAKDFSNLLPGHGGIMDRIDGMLMAAGAIYIYMSFFMMGLGV